MGFGKIKDGKALWEVLLGQGGELGLIALPTLHKGPQALLGVVFGVRIEDRFDLGSNGAFEALFGDVVLRPATAGLQVELASLPRAGVEGCFESSAQSGMRIGDDEVGNANAALFQGGEKLPPVDPGLREGARHTKYDAFTITAAHSDRLQGGAIAHHAVDPDLVVGGIKDEAAHFFEVSFTPFCKLFIELFVEV